MYRLRVAALLLSLVPLLGIESCEQDELQKLEAERQRLLDTTVPKQEFWDQVGRKGESAKQLRQLEKEIAEARAQQTGMDASAAPTREALANARDVNARAEEIRRDALAQRDALKVELSAAQAKLARWGAP